MVVPGTPDPPEQPTHRTGWQTFDRDDDALANLSPSEIRQILDELDSCQAKLARQDQELRQAQDALSACARYEELCAAEYQQSENALRNSQELLNFIIAHNQSAIAVYDREMRYVYVGNRYLNDCRARGQEVIGQSHYELFPSVPEKWREAHRRAMAGEVLSAEKDSYIREDGSEAWIRWECRPWYEADGAVGGIVLYTEEITERMQAEAALRESEEKYRQLIENAGEAIFVVQDSIIQFANCHSMGLVGLPQSELIGRSVMSFLSPEDQAEAGALEQQFMREEISEYRREFRIVDAGGGMKWVFLNTVRIVWNGKPATLNFASDITRHKQTEAMMQMHLDLIEFAVSHSVHEVLQKALDQVAELTGSEVGFYHFVEGDQQTLSLQAWSTRTLQEFCWAEGEGRHYPIAQAGVWVDCIRERRPVIHNDYASLPHRKGMPTGHPAVIRELVVPIFRADKVVAVLGVGNKPVEYAEDDTEIVARFADLVWEIIDRKRVEEALRKSEETHRLLVQNLQVGIVVHGPDTQIILANDQAHQLLGLDTHHALGKTAHDPTWYFMRRDGSRLPLAEYPVMQVLTTRTPIENLVYGIKHPDNQNVIWVMVNAFPEFEQDGSLRQIVVIFVDVSKQIQAEALAQDLNEQLRHQERLAAVGQLAAGIAHDFNNILAVIALQVPLVGRSPAMDERDRKRLAVIQSQVGHAARLIQQILDFSRRAVLERHPLDLAPFLTDQVNLLSHTLPETIRVSLDCEPGEHVALVDLTRMQQMVMNLAVNARDAMPKGGSLRLALAHQDTPPRPDLPAGPWLRLTVADSGWGISTEDLPHIFEPFFTTKAPGQGSGLGLPQIHGIVKQHGGEIEVESIVGRGTTFTVFLPAVTTQTRPTPPGRRQPWVCGGQTILIVEDNPALLTALQDIIEMLGYRTLAASDGQDALKIMDEHGAAIHLVLSDLVMPGMGGEELLAALCERESSVPVVILSGHPLDGELAGLTAKGLAGWLLKPVDVDLLAQTLAQVLG